MKSFSAGSTILALLGVATTVAGQYTEFTFYLDDNCESADDGGIVINGMQSWEDPRGDGVVAFDTCVSVDDPEVDPAATAYVKYECADNVVSMTTYSEAACTTEIATTLPYSNCTESTSVACAATAEELGVAPEEEWVSETTFHEDWPCASPNGTVASHTVAEIMDWAAAANGTTCLEQGDVYTTMGCNDGVVTWLFYDGDNDDCSGEWSGIIKPSPNCYGLAADDAGYAAVTCTAVTTDDSDDPDISGSSPQAALLSGGNLFMAAVAVATTASLAFSAIFT